MPRHLGNQPIREVIWRRGITHGEFIDEIGVKPSSHVRSAMNGVVAPREDLRRKAVEYLGVPIEELFTPEALATTYMPQGPGRRRGKASVSA